MTRIEALRSAINAKVERSNSLRAALQEYATRDGDPTDDERAQFEADVAEFEAAGPELERMQAELTQLEGIAAAPERARVAGSPTVMVRKADPIDDESVQYGPTEQVRGAARTAIENIPLTDDNVRAALYTTLERADDVAGTLARHMIAASRPAYRSAWSKVINGRSYALTAEESRSLDHVRAASLTDASGGYAVPTVLDPTLIITGTHDGMTGNPVRQLATVRQITGDNLNVVSSAGVTASWTTEATEATDDAPTLSTLALTPYKANVTIPYTIEISQDWVGMEADMRNLMMISKDDLELEAFTTGNGSNRPIGLFYDIYTNYTGQVQASAGSNTFTEPDLYALIQKVAYRWRNRGVFMANEIILDKVRQMNVASAGSVWVQLAADRPGTILGRPVYGNPQVDGTYGSGENYVMLFGDIAAAYTIVDRVGMVVEPVQHLFGSSNNLPNGMRALYAYWRTGGRVVNSGAVAVLNIT